MANFTNKTFLDFDDYMTPKYAWEDIKHFIPKNKIIWESFFGDGKSGDYLKDMGFDVIHEQIDFFNNEPEKWDIIVSNPPFTQIKQILYRLKTLDKPFILIMPVSKINTLYFRELFKDSHDLDIIIPKKRIQFQKLINGKTPENFKNHCNFDCFYYCYKMNLPQKINWL